MQNWTTILSADPPSPTGGLRIFKFAFMGRFVSPVGATFQHAHTMDASTRCLIICIKPVHAKFTARASQGYPPEFPRVKLDPDESLAFPKPSCWLRFHLLHCIYLCMQIDKLAFMLPSRIHSSCLLLCAFTLVSLANVRCMFYLLISPKSRNCDGSTS